MVAGADHFLVGRTDKVAGLVAAFAASLAWPSLGDAASPDADLSGRQAGRTVTPAAAMCGLGLGHRVLAEVEDRRGQHGVGAALGDALDEVVEGADAAAGDDRDADGVGDGRG